MRRTLWRLIVFGAAFAFAACSMLHSGKPAASGAPSASSAEASSDASAQASPSAEGSPAEAAPGATVAVSYAHKGDYLASLSVSKYSGAEMVESRNVDPQHVESIILFDGGVTVWEIKADTGVFSKLPVLGSGDKFAVKSVAYGKLPDHFVQATPDSGQPEPLETGHYYIFTAQRASGTLSYEAVRVEADGTLDGYAAEPRAGTSYVLCCNVNPDFVQPAPPLVPPADSDSGP